MESNAMYNQTKVENLKRLLFKDCHDSRNEFIHLHTNGRPSGVGEKRNEDNATAVRVGTNGVITMMT